MAGIDDIDTKPPMTAEKVVALLKSTRALEENYVKQIALLQEMRESALVHWAGKGAMEEATYLRHEVKCHAPMAEWKLKNYLQKLETRARARAKALEQNAG
jgi:hypothetical protein